MSKTFMLAWTAVFVAWMAGSFLVHGVLLGDDYAALPDLFRSEADSAQLFPLMILAHVMMSGALVWIYSRGVEGGPWVPQGVRFGVAVALLGVIPTYMIYFVVQPMPGALAGKQIAGDGVLVLLLGVIAACFYRGEAGARS